MASDRVKEDKSLERHVHDGRIERPIVIIQIAPDGKGELYRVFPAEGDPTMTNPKRCGVLLSDLLDHLVAAYHSVTGRDERLLREEMVKVFKDENRFKDQQPGRGGARGTTVFPKRN